MYFLFGSYVLISVFKNHVPGAETGHSSVGSLRSPFSYAFLVSWVCLRGFLPHEISPWEIGLEKVADFIVHDLFRVHFIKKHTFGLLGIAMLANPERAHFESALFIPTCYWQTRNSLLTGIALAFDIGADFFSTDNSSDSVLSFHCKMSAVESWTRRNPDWPTGITLPSLKFWNHQNIFFRIYIFGEIIKLSRLQKVKAALGSWLDRPVSCLFLFTAICWLCTFTIWFP